jgi:hypothetical protein
MLTATPNTTAPDKNKATASPPFMSTTVFVPGHKAASKNVRFLSNPLAANENVVKNAFQVISRNIAIQDRNSFVMDLFCRFPIAIPGLWPLIWNETPRS